MLAPAASPSLRDAPGKLAFTAYRRRRKRAPVHVGEERYASDGHKIHGASCINYFSRDGREAGWHAWQDSVDLNLTVERCRASFDLRHADARARAERDLQRAREESDLATAQELVHLLQRVPQSPACRRRGADRRDAGVSPPWQPARYAQAAGFSGASLGRANRRYRPGIDRAGGSAHGAMGAGQSCRRDRRRYVHARASGAAIPSPLSAVGGVDDVVAVRLHHLPGVWRAGSSGSKYLMRIAVASGSGPTAFPGRLGFGTSCATRSSPATIRRCRAGSALAMTAARETESSPCSTARTTLGDRLALDRLGALDRLLGDV